MEKIVKKEENMMETNVEKFISYIDVCENTKIAYRAGLKNFYEYMNERGIKAPNREDILAYKDHLKETCKPATINLYLTAVKNLYSFLEYEDITKDITKNIKNMKVGNEHKRSALNVEQCTNVLNNCKDIREKVLFLLATTCGIRANELVNIKLEDFKEREGKICLYLLGKGRDYKQDFVIVDSQVFELIKKYVEEYSINDYLFTSRSNHNTNGKLTTKTIRLIIKNMFKRVGIDGDEYSCHSLRHSFATISIENGTDIREVSQALRHRNLSTSMIYLHDLDKLNNKCSNSVTNTILGGI